MGPVGDRSGCGVMSDEISIFKAHLNAALSPFQEEADFPLFRCEDKTVADTMWDVRDRADRACGL